MHFGSAVVLLLNSHFPAKFGICRYTVNTIMTLWNVSILIFICMEFFVVDEEEPAEGDGAQETEKPTVEPVSKEDEVEV